MDKKIITLLLFFLAAGQVVAQNSWAGHPDPAGGYMLFGSLLIFAAASLISSSVLIITLSWAGAMFWINKNKNTPEKRSNILKYMILASIMGMILLLSLTILTLFAITVMAGQIPEGGVWMGTLLLIAIAINPITTVILSMVYSPMICIIAYLIDRFIDKKIKNQYMQYTIAALMLLLILVYLGAKLYLNFDYSMIVVLLSFTVYWMFMVVLANAVAFPLMNKIKDYRVQCAIGFILVVLSLVSEIALLLMFF